MAERNQANLLLSKMMLEGRSFSGHERNCCYLNTGASSAADGRFANISAASGIDFPDDGRAVAVVDWDHDGDLDLWISNRNAPRLRFLRNDLPRSGRFLSLRLVGNGTTTNRDAIGARVELELENPQSAIGNPKSIKTLRAGEGFLSQNSKWLHFGLGTAESVQKVIVRWPDGTTEQFGTLASDARYVIEQGSGEASVLEPAVRHLVLRHEDQVVPASSQKATLRLVSPLTMPPLSYQTLAGEEQRLPAVAGRPLLVNLWASWCKPCLEELTDFASRAQEIKAAELDVIALSVDGLGEDNSSPLRAAEYLESIGFPFRSGRASNALVASLQVMHDLQTMLRQPLLVPTSFLIDSRGRLIAIYKGTVSVEDVLDELAHVGQTREERFRRASAMTGRVIEHKVARRTFDMIEAERRFNFASWLQQLGYQEQVAEQYRIIMELWPNSAKAHADFGGALIQQGQLRPAEQHLKKALTIDSEFSGAHLRLGNLYLKQRRLLLAVTHLEQAHQLSPEDVSIVNNLGTVFGQLGQHQRAIDEFAKAIQLMPTEAGAYNNLAWLYATCADPKYRNGEAAISMATKACELTDWNRFDTLDTLAAASAQARHYEDAIRWQAKAIAVAPAAQKGSLRQRLDLYRVGKPYLEPHR